MVGCEGSQPYQTATVTDSLRCHLGQEEGTCSHLGCGRYRSNRISRSQLLHPYNTSNTDDPGTIPLFAAMETDRPIDRFGESDFPFRSASLPPGVRAPGEALRPPPPARGFYWPGGSSQKGFMLSDWTAMKVFFGTRPRCDANVRH